MKPLFAAAAAVIYLCTSGADASERNGSVMNTDDICTVRPDLCGKSMKRTKRRKTRTVSSADTQKKKKSVQKVRKRPVLNEEADNQFFDLDKSLDLNSEEKLETANNMNREPAFAKPQAIAVAPSAPPPRRKVSFSSYLTSNSGHPSLAVRRSTRQDAFQPIIRPSVLTDPGSGSATPEVPVEPGAGSAAPQSETTSGSGN